MQSLFKLLALCAVALAFLAATVSAEDLASNKRIEISFERRNVSDVFNVPGAAVGKSHEAAATVPVAASDDVDADEEWGQDSYDEEEEDYSLYTSDLEALEKRGKKRYSGKGTYFYPGLGNCGSWNGNNDLMVAIPTSMYGGGKHCGKWMKICSGGKCVNAQVKDSCPSCGWGSLDLSPRVFKALAPLSRGVIGLSWNYL